MKTIFHTAQTTIEEIINKCEICFVGVVTSDNKPYVIPMNFGYQDNILYFHGASEGRVIDSLNNNNNVCITFSTDHQLVYQHIEVACSYRMKSKSVIAFGKVEFVENMDEKRDALNIIMKHYSDKTFVYNDPAVKNVKVWKVPVDEICCKEFGAK